jgi:predicted alpha-1,2-mannosidase
MFNFFSRLNKFILIALLIMLAACHDACRHDVLDLVNPFVGTDGHGHTFPGASVPFGMVQLSPDTRKDNWDACSGYHYSDTAILGFSHTHLSGTGVGDYGDIRFMPMSGNLQIRPGKEDEPGYRSKFSHNKEKASPGYYKVFLEDSRINAEFTVTSRCGFHQYTFPESAESYILIDLTESVMSEKNPELSVQVINDHEISGFRRSSGWAADQFVYFYAIFSKPFIESGTASDGVININSRDAGGNDIQAFVKYSTKKNEKILIKVGISAVSVDGARKNLESEIPVWDFDKIRHQAESAWRDELTRIEIRGGNRDDMIKFYTALYHCYLAPNLFSDADGHYRGHDGNMHLADNFNVYTVFSLWDTYRALHPLLTILQPERTVDFIKTFLDIYEKGGLLPVWELAGNETNCMIGYHAVPVIVDAYLKGIDGFDQDKAFSAIVKSASQDHFGLKYYKESGYIPAEAEGEAVSKTLEYAYDDWCIAQMAKKLGKENEYTFFIERSQYYKNIFDPDTRFLRGKRNGMFTEPFDPAEVNFMLTEANTWQYTFYVPQDIAGLKELMGGDKAFENKLDEMFSQGSGLSGREQSDITGLIGQYAHGNEPSHHMAYLYNYVGKPAKTQKLVRRIMDELYGADADGLCGNEDCGQMSAWFVMSAMGFYPVTPGSGYYTIGSPLFEKITIHLENGKDFIIKSDNNSKTDIFIQSATLNGENLEKAYLTHEQLMNGGTLACKMGSQPSGDWGKEPANHPISAITDHLINPVPFYQAASGSFQDSLEIRLRDINENAVIYYWVNDEKPDNTIERYRDPIVTDHAITVSSYAVIDSLKRSKIAKAEFHKIHNDWSIFIKNPYSAQYTGGGDLALIDGQRGGPNFRTGSWQGYQGVDFETTIDMGKLTKINNINASFLQDQRSWIFMPEKVEISVSSDSSDFRMIADIDNDLADTIREAVIKDFVKDGLHESGRYVRIRAVNRGVCPQWHVGAGDKAWIFVDEIIVE